MAFADSNRADVYIIEEATWGTTPSSGNTRQRRYTSHNILPTKEMQRSNEIRSDRMVPKNLETGAGSGGDINWEFAAGTVDDDLQAVLAGTWTRPMTMEQTTGVHVAWGTTSRLDISGMDLTTWPMFTVGRRVKVEGFALPNNNGYFQISAVAYTSSQTRVTMTTTTSTIEAGNVFSRVMDANDVIVLNSTAIRLGTSGAATIDSNGGNAFATAVAAEQLVVGQRIFIDGLGIESGTVAFSAVGTVGDKITVSDGTDTVVFTAGTDFAIGASATDSAANLATAINAARVAGTLNCAATAATGTATVRNLNVTGGTITETVDGGAAITVTNFSGGSASSRGFFTITSVADDVLGVSPTPPTNANAGSLKVNIKGSMLRNPSDIADITLRSWTVETHFTDVTKQFSANGQRPVGMSMDVASRAITTGTTTLMGKEVAKVSTRRLALSPYTALPTVASEIVNATTNVGSITKNGSSLASGIKQVQWSIEGNARPRDAVGNKYPVDIGLGSLVISGTVNAYFENTTLFDHFKDHDAVALAYPIIDDDLNTYYFTFPAVRFATDNIAPSGIDQDVMEEITFMAERDPVTSCEMQVDRFSSTRTV